MYVAVASGAMHPIIKTEIKHAIEQMLNAFATMGLFTNDCIHLNGLSKHHNYPCQSAWVFDCFVIS